MTPQFRRLPELEVRRGIYCSQQVTDRAIDFLQANNPELIQELLVEEGAQRAWPYFNVAYEVIDYLTEAGVEVPTTSLGKMDLISELSRRLRKAYGFAEVEPRGKPLAAGPDHPLPPLINLEIDEASIRRGGLTQAITDTLLQMAYDKRPDLWYAVAEEYRFLVLPYAIEEFRALLKQIAEAESIPTANHWTMSELTSEAARRIYAMCEIK